MAVNLAGILAILSFYVLIAICGIWAARVSRRKSKSETENLIVGGRDIGLFLGFCTLSATWVGGGEVNGSAETVYDPTLGALWAIGPIGYGISMIINGAFFAKKMRDGNYMTILDPFQYKLGRLVSLIYFMIDFICSILYVSALLTAIGGTLEVVAGLPRVASVLSSAAISAFYTMLGGLYSVAYTDVVQLALMVFGLALAVPFAMTHEAVSDLSETWLEKDGWLMRWDSTTTGVYIDTWLLVIFSGIPLQTVYQRILAADSTRHAKILCATAGVVTSFMGIPPVLLGAVGASANWTMVSYMNGNGTSPADEGNARLILPVVLQYFTPTVVAIFGLGAISAAGMSSIDSELLAVSSEFGKNVYKEVLRTKASEREVVWAIRLTILVAAASASTISLSANSITALYYFSSDLIYVLTFPTLLSLLYFDPNVYGVIPALIIGFVLRIGGGEYFLDWSPPFSYIGGYNFPARTVSMLSTLASLNLFSYIAKVLFEKGYIPEKYDVLHSNLARGGRSRFMPRKQMTNDTSRDVGGKESRMVPVNVETQEDSKQSAQSTML